MKKLLIILTLTFMCGLADAQLWQLRRIEVSGGAGATQFFGDIGGYPNSKNILGIRDFTFKQTRFNINGSLRYRITEDISIRGNLVLGMFHSTDARGSNIRRGFESQTIFAEPSLLAEYYFIKNKGENSYIFLQGKNTVLYSIFQSLDFYVFTGIGGLAYKVTPNSLLTPFATKTSGFTSVVPVGLGVTMIYNSKINLGLELGGRFTFSDNLEGFTSAQSTANDLYYLLNFVFTYKIKRGKRG